MAVTSNILSMGETFQRLQGYLQGMVTLIEQKNSGEIDQKTFNQKFRSTKEALRTECETELKAMGGPPSFLKKTPGFKEIKSFEDLRFLFAKLLQKIEKFLNKSQPKDLLKEVQKLNKDLLGLMVVRKDLEEKQALENERNKNKTEAKNLLNEPANLGQLNKKQEETKQETQEKEGKQKREAGNKFMAPGTVKEYIKYIETFKALPNSLTSQNSSNNSNNKNLVNEEFHKLNAIAPKGEQVKELGAQLQENGLKFENRDISKTQISETPLVPLAGTKDRSPSMG